MKAQGLSVPNRDIAINLDLCCRLYNHGKRAGPRILFSNLVGNSIKHSTGPLIVNIKLACIEKTTGRIARWPSRTTARASPTILRESYSTICLRAERGDRAGLGLWLVKSLVDSYGGQVRDEDRVPDHNRKGARFVVMLPAAGQ